MTVDCKAILHRIKARAHANRLAWLAFGIPAALLLLGFFTRGVFPIANRNVLTIDLFHQYAPFLAELQHKLKAGESLLYSWSGGLGVNFYALFAYYLASPLNLLILLFPPAYLTEAVLLLVVVKIGLAGACFYRFLAGVHRKDSLLMVVLSSFYALSAFSMAYYWNIMWLDTLFLLPLLLLGLVRMVRDGRWLLYTLSLALLIYSNYYMAFFACLFTGLYFLVCLFQYQTLARPGPFFAAIGRTVLFTALGAGLSAVLSLPTFFSLQATSAAGDAFPVDWQHLYDLLDYMGQHYLLQPPAIRSGMPNLYAGILLLFLLPLYVLSRRLSVKEKLLNLSLFVFLVISFNVNVFNFIWHGLHFPNQLPYRNAFVYVFLVLTMAYPALEEVPSFSGRQIGGLALAAAGSVLLAQKVLASPPSWLTVLVTLLFIVLYAVLLTLPHSRSISRFDWSRALLILVVVELAVHVFVSLHMIDLAESLSNRDGYLDGRQVAEIRQELKRIDREEGDGFYRLEVQPPRTTNDPFLYSYRGISIFASTMQTKPVTFFENLGYHSNGINSYKYEGSTLVLDSLFGLKYLIRRSGEQVYDLLQLQAQTDQITTYRNPYALSFGLLGSEALLDWQSGPGSPFDAQNRLFEALSGEKDVFRPLTTDEGELNNLSFTSKGSHQFAYRKGVADQEATARLTVDTQEDQALYLYFDVPANRAKHGYVLIDETKIEFNARRSTLVDCGQVPAGSQVTFVVTFEADSPENGRFELHACALDRLVFENGISQLMGQSLTVTTFKPTRVKGQLLAEQPGVLLLTTPADPGWTVTLNGQPQPTQMLDDGLILLPVPAGAHSLEMVYRPPWLRTGGLISLGSLLVLLLLTWLARRRARRRATPMRLSPPPVGGTGVRPVLIETRPQEEAAAPDTSDA